MFEHLPLRAQVSNASPEPCLRPFLYNPKTDLTRLNCLCFFHRLHPEMVEYPNHTDPSPPKLSRILPSQPQIPVWHSQPKRQKRLIGPRSNSGPSTCSNPFLSPPRRFVHFTVAGSVPTVGNLCSCATKLPIAGCVVAAERFVARVLVAPLRPNQVGSEATRTLIVHQKSTISRVGSFKYSTQLEPDLGTKRTPLRSQIPVGATAHTFLVHETGAAQRAGTAHAGLFRAIRRMVSSLHSLAVG